MIETAVPDKTGNLTFGDPYVTVVAPAARVNPMIVLRMATIAERPSEHPLGRAILKEAARIFGDGVHSEFGAPGADIGYSAPLSL